MIELSLSHGIRSKVASEYGEGKILIAFVDLLDHYRKIHDDLRTSTRSAWIVQERKEIFELFDKKVDPLREHLQNELRTRYSVKAILNDRMHRVLCSKES